MSKKKHRRPFFQIHLSTAFIMMLSAFVFVLLDVWADRTMQTSSEPIDRLAANRNLILLLFGVIEFFALVAIAEGCEYIIRRREGRKL